MKTQAQVEITQNLVNLGKWISKRRKLKEHQIPKVDLAFLRSLLSKINKKLDLNITFQSKHWLDEALEDLKG
ncbi:14659_t:CDS:1, partial [Gigaspora margarita]